MGEILEIKNVSKTYQHKNGETLAIKDVNFEVNKGEFVSIIGPSGCRKVNNTVSYCRFRRNNRR